jgi:hypothetical protein
MAATQFPASITRGRIDDSGWAPMQGRWLAVAALLAAGLASAEPRFTVTAASRDETDSEDQLPAAGFFVDFGAEGWRARPEVGVTLGLDPLYGGHETEISAGILGHLDAANLRVHFGGGLSRLASDFGANADTTGGYYLHAGASWGIARRFRLGFDVRYLTADDLVVYDTPLPAGFFQLGALFQF